MRIDTGALSDHHAERVLLTRARRGDLEALRGLVHRYASLVWAACAQVTADESEATRRFGECWEAVLGSLDTARRSPDLAGMILRLCHGRLVECVPEERAARAVASAHQLAADSSAFVEAPPPAVLSVTDGLAGHAERLRRLTETRRVSRRRSTTLPAAVGLAVVVGVVAAFVVASRPTPQGFLARCLRARVATADLVPRFRDVVSPPFEASEREGPEARQYEEIGLVLEELVNLPKDADMQQVVRLQRRVQALDLVDFAAHEADRAPAGNRAVLNEVCLVLEELVNL
jgi:hypothetical protein